MGAKSAKVPNCFKLEQTVLQPAVVELKAVQLQIISKYSNRSEFLKNHWVVAEKVPYPTQSRRSRSVSLISETPERLPDIVVTFLVEYAVGNRRGVRAADILATLKFYPQTLGALAI